jgi:hypothetical protein
MASSTLLTLVVIPAIYGLIKGLQREAKDEAIDLAQSKRQESQA